MITVPSNTARMLRRMIMPRLASSHTTTRRAVKGDFVASPMAGSLLFADRLLQLVQAVGFHVPLEHASGGISPRPGTYNDGHWGVARQFAMEFQFELEIVDFLLQGFNNLKHE